MTSHAIILAAGQGMRLRAVVDDRPKGLIEIGGEPLVARSIRLLRAAGIRRVTLVAGYRSSQYTRLLAHEAGVVVVENAGFATTGSMASLATALKVLTGDDDLLVLESDIIYEPRALDVILQSHDTTLASGATGAGDEVWIHTEGNRLRAMSKDRGVLRSVAGEFVGITHLSRAAADAMRDELETFVAAHGHARMDYETGALVAVAQRLPIVVALVADLQWGEIDDERHYARVMSMTWPAR
jgi:2-aminoethylphosphonate-pyruvate transaminase